MILLASVSLHATMVSTAYIVTTLALQHASLIGVSGALVTAPVAANLASMAHIVTRSANIAMEEAAISIVASVLRNVRADFLALSVNTLAQVDVTVTVTEYRAPAQHANTDVTGRNVTKCVQEPAREAVSSFLETVLMVAWLDTMGKAVTLLVPKHANPWDVMTLLETAFWKAARRDIMVINARKRVQLVA